MTRINNLSAPFQTHFLLPPEAASICWDVVSVVEYTFYWKGEEVAKARQLTKENVVAAQKNGYDVKVHRVVNRPHRSYLYSKDGRLRVRFRAVRIGGKSTPQAIDLSVGGKTLDDRQESVTKVKKILKSHGLPNRIIEETNMHKCWER